MLLLGAGITVASAAEPSVLATADQNKWRYNLFNPTPRPLMREMSTDRPDKTESAYTVDAGHFQFEADLVSFGIDRWNADGKRGFGANVANVNLKAGLYNNVDLQLVVENYVYEQVRADSVTVRKSGFGDLTTRLKVDLWGNYGGRTAFAVFLFAPRIAGATQQLVGDSNTRLKLRTALKEKSTNILIQAVGSE
ncbi:MAG TPA: transporter [Terrimicrobiaceae bacterium]|nr:transporter [Terrimicrobiaceae bacterium]